MFKLNLISHRLILLSSKTENVATRAWRSTQVSQVAAIDDDMPVEMENPFKPETKRCLLCGVRVDYKNVQLLSQFVSSHTGMPMSQKMSGLCDKKYENIQKNIKLSRQAGYMAMRTKEPSFLRDPDVTGQIKSFKKKKIAFDILEKGNENTDVENKDEKGNDEKE